MSISFSPVLGILQQGQFTQTPAFGSVYVLCAGGPRFRMVPLNHSRLYDDLKRYAFRRNRTLGLGVCSFPVLVVRTETLPREAGQRRRRQCLVSPAAVRVSNGHRAAWS